MENLDNLFNRLNQWNNATEYLRNDPAAALRIIRKNPQVGLKQTDALRRIVNGIGNSGASLDTVIPNSGGGTVGQLLASAPTTLQYSDDIVRAVASGGNALNKIDKAIDAVNDLYTPRFTRLAQLFNKLT